MNVSRATESFNPIARILLALPSPFLAIYIWNSNDISELHTLYSVPGFRWLHSPMLAGPPIHRLTFDCVCVKFSSSQMVSKSDTLHTILDICRNSFLSRGANYFPIFFLDQLFFVCWLAVHVVSFSTFSLISFLFSFDFSAPSTNWRRTNKPKNSWYWRISEDRLFSTSLCVL